MPVARILVGDVGGTKTQLALFDPHGLETPIVDKTFQSADFESLIQLLRHFLLAREESIAQAVFGVAGPVVEGRAQITNLSWVIEKEAIQSALNLEAVHVINDLAAIANSVPYLQTSDLHVLNEGVPSPSGSRAVIAPGTGLGQAYLTWNGDQFQAHPSEGGHADFAPTSSLQMELLSFLQTRYDHVSYERLCSGMGIPNIYAFLKESFKYEEPTWLADKLSTAPDPTPIIVNAALAPGESCALCKETLKLFVSILAAEAGNLALKILATGGLYIGGGIPPRILPALETAKFMQSFTHKGRFSDLLSQIPVYVILNPRAALLGAAHYARASMPEP
jgi:glucokinase